MAYVSDFHNVREPFHAVYKIGICRKSADFATKLSLCEIRTHTYFLTAALQRECRLLHKMSLKER